MSDDTIREDVIKRFHTIPGLGLTRAELLYDSGFTTISSLKKASVEEVSAVKGITPSLARYILREVRTMPDEAPVEAKAAEGQAMETTAAGDGDTAAISVSDEVKVEAGEEAEAGEEMEGEAEGAEPAEEGPGFITSIVNTFKSIFGGGGGEAEAEPGGGLSEEELKAAGASVEVTEGEAEETKAEEEAAVEETPEEPTEAQITVGHEEEKAEVEEETKEEEEKVEEKVEEEAGTEATETTEEVKGTEGEVEEAPAEPEEKRSAISDLKKAGLSRIRAIRAKLTGKKAEAKEEEEVVEEKEEEEEKAEEEKVEEKEVEEVKEEEAEVEEEKAEEAPKKKEAPGKQPKGKKVETNTKIVDDIIKDLDLDDEG